VLNTQNALIVLNENKLEHIKVSVDDSISARHKIAAKISKEALDNIFSEDMKKEVVVSRNETEFENLFDNLNKLSE